jgi:prolipoprotein diacylglyceryl transferase
VFLAVTHLLPSSLASIPSPSSNALHLGPVQLHYYGLMIALGVIAAVWLARRRWASRGHDPDQILDLAFWTVPGGLIGARIYSVATDFNRLYADHPGDIIKVWKGGLGIPGGIIGGVAVGIWYAHRHKMALAPLFDIVAPCFPLAQAIGRFGNFFNQELYGRPTSLPWALRIDPAHRAAIAGKYPTATTFHPTFAYEALWNLALVALLLVVDRFRGSLPRPVLAWLYGFFALGFGADLWLVVQRQSAQPVGIQVLLFAVGTIIGAAIVWLLPRFDRRGPARWGDLFAVYIAAYFVGRLWVESLRIDTANTPGGLRVNEWTSIVAIAGAFIFLMVRRMRGTGRLATASNVPLYDVTESATDEVTGQPADESAGQPTAETSDESAGQSADDSAAQVADPRAATPDS